MSLVSFLVSCGLHLFFLVVLTILFVSAQSDQGAIDLTFSVATVSDSEDAFESFEMEMPISETPNSSTDEPTAVDTAPTGQTAPALELADFGSPIGGQEDGAALDLLQKTSRSKQQPSNRSGSFFGSNAYGDEFVFVVDSSRSMLSPCGFRYGKTRFEVACEELLRSINNLEKDQQYCVFFFGVRTRVMFDSKPKLVNATKQNARKLTQWIQSLGPGPGTDPRYGVMHAFKLKPDAIFLLSDGEFNGQLTNGHQIPGNPSVERIIRKQRRKIPIHTFAFEDLINRRRLREIAVATGGSHKYIGSHSQEQLLLADLYSSAPKDHRYAVQSLIDDPRQISRDQSVLRATQRLVKMLAASSPTLRESAHASLLALASTTDEDSEMLEDFDEAGTAEDYRSLQRKWTVFWKTFFRRTAVEQRLQLTQAQSF